MNPDVVKNKIYDDHFIFISSSYPGFGQKSPENQMIKKKIWPNTYVFIIYICDIVKSAKYLFIYFQPVAICL